MKKIKLPTGYLIVDDYSKGQLETLSIGDYGKALNIKADFLGHTRPVHGVPNGPIMPLQEKWVVTLSTQYGCPMKCTFCDVPNIPFKGNVFMDDLTKQLKTALSVHDVRYTDRLNIHFARMGEPIFNENVFAFAKSLQENKIQWQESTGVRIETIHPVLTTSCPMWRPLKQRLEWWAEIKQDIYNGQAGLQISVNTTDEELRIKMFGGAVWSLRQIAQIVAGLPTPLGRKYCLNFAYTTGAPVDAKLLASMFDPDSWMVKITPIHNNNATAQNGYETVGGYEHYAPYEEVELACKDAGFDVIVFVPSQDEEDGLITCGNAILGGSELKVGEVCEEV